MRKLNDELIDMLRHTKGTPEQVAEYFNVPFSTVVKVKAGEVPGRYNKTLPRQYYDPRLPQHKEEDDRLYVLRQHGIFEETDHPQHPRTLTLAEAKAEIQRLRNGK